MSSPITQMIMSKYYFLQINKGVLGGGEIVDSRLGELCKGNYARVTSYLTVPGRKDDI